LLALGIPGPLTGRSIFGTIHTTGWRDYGEEDQIVITFQDWRITGVLDAGGYDDNVPRLEAMAVQTPRTLDDVTHLLPMRMARDGRGLTHGILEAKYRGTGVLAIDMAHENTARDELSKVIQVPAQNSDIPLLDGRFDWRFRRCVSVTHCSSILRCNLHPQAV
jgi:hypothetical protein